MGEINAVAWAQKREEIDSLSAPLAVANKSGKYTEPLYAQSAIDALKAELAHWKKMHRVANSEVERLEARVELLEDDLNDCNFI